MCCTHCRPDWFRGGADCNCYRPWNSILPPPPCPTHGAWSPQTIQTYEFGHPERHTTTTIGWTAPGP